MFDQDHSAARGQMATRKLIVFQHESQLGNAPSHVLFDMVKVTANQSPAREFADFSVVVPKQDQMPAGVKIIERP